jgi:hypothetical protein
VLDDPGQPVDNSCAALRQLRTLFDDPIPIVRDRKRVIISVAAARTTGDRQCG